MVETEGKECLWICPPGEKPVGCKYVFKTEYKPNWEVEKCKVMLVAHGFPRQGSVCCWQLVIKMTGNWNRGMWSLHSYLGMDEEVYVKIQPRTNMKGNRGDGVLKMLGALYGFKQSSHEWNEMLHTFLMEGGFRQLKMDACIHTRREDSSRVMLSRHGEAHAIAGPNKRVLT